MFVRNRNTKTVQTFPDKQWRNIWIFYFTSFT